MRPSGANANAVGLGILEATASSINPDGTVAAACSVATGSLGSTSSLLQLVSAADAASANAPSRAKDHRFDSMYPHFRDVRDNSHVDSRTIEVPCTTQCSTQNQVMLTRNPIDLLIYVTRGELPRGSPV